MGPDPHRQRTGFDPQRHDADLGRSRRSFLHGRRADEPARLAARCGWNAWEARSAAADLCCGWVGRAYALLALYRHTGDGAWLERARQLADQARRAFARSTWRRPLSLFKGRAGLAVLAADLSRPERSAFPLFEREAPA